MTKINYISVYQDWIEKLPEPAKTIHLMFVDEYCTGRPGNNWYPGCYEIEAFKAINKDGVRKFDDFKTVMLALKSADTENPLWFKENEIEESWMKLVSSYELGIQAAVDCYQPNKTKLEDLVKEQEKLIVEQQNMLREQENFILNTIPVLKSQMATMKVMENMAPEKDVTMWTKISNFVKGL